MANFHFKWPRNPVLPHAARTTVVAVTSLLVARLFRLPESYWAPITAMVVTQSSLGVALAVSWQRFVGTGLGAAIGGLVATFLPPNVLVFAGCIFLLGLFCALTYTDHSAYRFGGVTLAVVVLIPRPVPPWQSAFHRFAEVSIGIGIALILAWVWPDKEPDRQKSGVQAQTEGQPRVPAA
jgi:uncharacterized membrane protein YccC